MKIVISVTSIALATIAASSAVVRSQSAATRPQAPADSTRSRSVPDDQFIRYPLLPSEQVYAAIDGNRLKEYVREITAISRRYRDRGHQYWGRIMGTEADAETAQWLFGKFQKAGLSNVRIQSLDLPPQWMPQSWEVVVSGGGRSNTMSLEQVRGGTAPSASTLVDDPGAAVQ